MVDYSKLAYVTIFMYFTIFTFKDLYAQTTDKQIPVGKVGLGSNIGPTLKFLYCYSCGYHKLFDDYSNLIKQKYPEISVQGNHYDPPGYQLFIAKIFGLGKFILIILICSEINIFHHLRAPTPFWWTWFTENKIYSCLMIFLMSNTIEGHLISTGAFEIMLNDMPVWSKLETGRIPQPPELFQIIDNHMLLEEPIDIKPGFPK